MGPHECRDYLYGLMDESAAKGTPRWKHRRGQIWGKHRDGNEVGLVNIPPEKLHKYQEQQQERQQLPALAYQTDENDPDLVELNTRYAVVNMHGKTRVLDLRDKDDGLRLSSFNDFANLHDAVRKKQGIDSKGHPVRMGIGTWWLHQLKRRQYDGVTFAPGEGECVDGEFNLWKGWAYAPKEGNCSLYLKHIREIICGGDDECYGYLLNVMADAVQNPNRQAGIAVVMHEGVLKALVTEPKLMIERKGIDAIQMPNRIHLFMASNMDWVIPAGASARRFFVLDVLPSRRGNLDYFKAIEKQMQDGGYEALMYVLVNRDLCNFEIRNVPNTQALAKQKAHSRSGIDKLVETLCHEGVLPYARISEPDIVLTGGEGEGKGFYAAVIRMVPSLKAMGGIRVASLLKENWGVTNWRNSQERGLRFPPLSELRAKFDAKHGVQDWPEAQNWTCEPQFSSCGIINGSSHSNPDPSSRHAENAEDGIGSRRDELDEEIPF